MDDEKSLNGPTSRKSSAANGENGKGKEINNGGGEEVALKAKMSLVNGITVIVGSIIGKFQGDLCSRRVNFDL